LNPYLHQPIVASWDKIRAVEILENVVASLVTRDGIFHIFLLAGLLGVIGWILLVIGMVTEGLLRRGCKKKRWQNSRLSDFSLGLTHLGLLCFLLLYGVMGILFSFRYITPVPMVMHFIPLSVGLLLGFCIWITFSYSLQKRARRTENEKTPWISLAGRIGLLVIVTDIAVLMITNSELSEIWLKATGHWR